MNQGPVAIQGCAIRLSRLNADGSIPGTSATGMIVDDRPFVKFTAKPAVEAGVEMNPKSACGQMIIAYKDFDRIKRWDATLDFSNYDFERMELIGGGDLITAATSAGRTFADGVTVTGDTHVHSPALAAFTSDDYGRTLTGTGIPAESVVVLVVSATEVVIDGPATASASGVSLTLGALPAARTIGYRWPELLTVANPNGVAIEIWQKAIVKGTNFQGTAPYPHAGSNPPHPVNPSPWMRFGAFRFIPSPIDIGIEDKESSNMFSGWCVENPNFGTGPVHDWTTTAVAGSGVAVDTTRWANVMMDFQLPSTLQSGYQTTS